MTMTTRPAVCKYCDTSLTRNARSCATCGAYFEVRETSVKSMYLMAGVMAFGALVFGNALYQNFANDYPLDTVSKIALPGAVGLVSLIGLWFLKQARHPRTWFEWHEGTSDFADMKILDAGGVLPEQGGRRK